MKSEVTDIFSSLRIRRVLSDKNPRNEDLKRRAELWPEISDRWHQFCSSVIKEFESTASSILSGLQFVYYEVDLFERKPKLVELIDDCQRETEAMKPVIRKALHKRGNGGDVSVSAALDLTHIDEWWSAVLSVLKGLMLNLHIISRREKLMMTSNGGSGSNINTIKQVKILINSLQEVLLYGQFIADVKKYLRYHRFTPPTSIDPFRTFLNHVRSVAVRIAIQSCNCCFSMSRNCNTSPRHRSNYSCWFNCKAKPTDLTVSKKFSRLVDLHQQIDPVKPEFLKLNLIFLEAVRNFSTNIEHQFFCFDDDDFLRSILLWKVDYEFKGHMMHLVAIVLTNKLDYSCEEVQTFFAEIRAVLEKAASLSRLPLGHGNEADPLPPPSELDRNICLLIAEYYLKYQLNESTFHGDGLKFGISSGYMLKPHATTDCWKHSLALIKDVEDKVASLHCYLSCPMSNLENSFLQLLLEIGIFKAEFFLLEFLKSNAGANHEKVKVESLLEHLKVFHLILTNMLKEHSDKVEFIFTHTEAITWRATLFSYSFFPNAIIEEMLAFSFCELLDKAQHIKAKLKEISPMFPVSNFPTTYKLGFIDFLFRNLGELLKYSPKSIAPMKKHIEEIQLHLKSFLVKVSDSDMENPGLKDLIDHMTGVVYKLDYTIDSIDVDAHWQHFFWFYDLLEELRLIDKQASSVHATISDANVQNFSKVTISDATVQNFNSLTISGAIVQNVNSVTIFDATIQSSNNLPQDSRHTTSWDRVPAINEVVLDLKDEEEFIIGQLTRQSSKRDIVSIIGTPGIGKTTLAAKVFNNQQIISHFHRLAWCTVSQVYEKRKLLLEIIDGIQGLTRLTCQMSMEDLELKLYWCLLKNRYLIVMDDVWSVRGWNDLKYSFPDDCNESRILFTNRQCIVDFEIKLDSDPYSLRPFSVEENWKLLEKKVFKGEYCPEQLLMVRKEIAQHCQGLPLAVVAIAGLLERTEKSIN